MIYYLFKTFNYFNIMHGDWGLGIGDWGLGIPNPQSPFIVRDYKIFYNLNFC